VYGLDSEGALAFVWNDYTWAKREVGEHHAALTRAYPVDPERIVLGGFSRGAEMAIQLALSGAVPAQGFIAVCPGGPNSITPELWEPIVAKAKGRNLRGYVIMGGQDRFVPGTEHLVKLLGEAGIQHEFEVHPDMGHDYPPDFKDRLGKMLAYVLDR
jgi:predicted esterase